MASKVLYKQGTKETYLGLKTHLPNALYWCSDTLELFKGDDLYSAGVKIVTELPEFGLAAQGRLYVVENEGFILNDTLDGWIQVIYDLQPVNDSIDKLNNAVADLQKICSDELPKIVEGKTDAIVSGDNGNSLIFNEPDGGGIKFENVDKTWSFVGVNDGGKDGITGQLYSVDSETKVGTRLNMTSDGFYYTRGKSNAEYDENDEIATKKDILEAALIWDDI